MPGLIASLASFTEVSVSTINVVGKAVGEIGHNVHLPHFGRNGGRPAAHISGRGRV